MAESDFATAFGEALLRQIGTRAMSQSDLARKMSISRTYINRTVAGRTLPSPAWVNRAATAIDATQDERQELHQAAAQTRGYQLDLTPQKR